MSQRKRLVITGMSGLVALAFLAASPVSANSLTNSMKRLPGINRYIQKNRVNGTVSTVTGTTIALNVNERDASSTTSTLYTIDASNATVYKAGATSTVSAIQAGDELNVTGTVSGTSVVAKTIIDGAVVGGIVAPHFSRSKNTKNASTTEIWKGNYTLGNVTSVNGSNFTIVDKAHRANATTTTYTVMTDGSTVFKKAGQSAVLSDVTVGEFVMVAGAKNSSDDTITATNVNVVTRKSGKGK